MLRKLSLVTMAGWFLLTGSLGFCQRYHTMTTIDHGTTFHTRYVQPRIYDFNRDWNRSLLSPSLSLYQNSRTNDELRSIQQDLSQQEFRRQLEYTIQQPQFRTLNSR